MRGTRRTKTLYRKDGTSGIKLPDAVIAATALTENYILATRNIDDFKHISDLELLNPWDTNHNRPAQAADGKKDDCV
jgi:predicted nucleic acid-binding protein